MLIAEDGIFRNKWPMGRVTNVFLGHDDKVRSAKVRTATSEIHRPVSKFWRKHLATIVKKIDYESICS